MTARTTFAATVAAAAAFTFAAPAFADCAKELKAFDGKLAGLQEQSADSTPMETAAGDKTEASELQALDKDTQSEVVSLIDGARAAAESGDEAGCTARLSEARNLIKQD